MCAASNVLCVSADVVEVDDDRLISDESPSTEVLFQHLHGVFLKADGKEYLASELKTTLEECVLHAVDHSKIGSADEAAFKAKGDPLPAIFTKVCYS